MTRLSKTPQTLVIQGVTIAPGEVKRIDIQLGQLYTQTPMTMPIQVHRGYQDGPILLVSAAIHGDELNGVEIVRRLLKHRQLKHLKGTLIAVPIVNVHGFINQSRYLPDGRDLNRSFPGSERGSLAGRLAYLFIQDILALATHAIDLHTGARHRTNLAQVRVDLAQDQVLELAKAFGAPVILNSNLRDGSLREAAVKLGVPTILYEAGEALRFDEVAIRAGVQGILRVMRQLGMVRSRTVKQSKSQLEPVIARGSSWVRAPQGGIFRSLVRLGQKIEANQTLIGDVADPLGEQPIAIYAPVSGVVIGLLQLPLVHEGEALCHIASFSETDQAVADIEQFTEQMNALISDQG
ncbi:succinylglutamate desuccinylase [Thiomicrospira aerophila AL3]|uniref:Succinylglutamate desuccinylase n=1 Tax=Thiomicrospira aerophila AL3 TaxID=717772 RepID=W0DXB3_9GAMM|nr:succinylglutamate desuccinylase/aspartoacylase family protein [Thiomicrospira aerophila]AHF01614.1 succinylglutamate desuccinylase [Thiomicrospira aerophila AL3]